MLAKALLGKSKLHRVAVRFAGMKQRLEAHETGEPHTQADSQMLAGFDESQHKFYDPWAHDPQNEDYQESIQMLSAENGPPDEINESDIAESVFYNLYQTEITWTVFFFAGWAAF